MSKSESRIMVSRLTAIRCTPENKLQITNLAKEKGMTVPGYLRQAALHRNVYYHHSQDLVNELRDLGRRQKEIFDNGADSDSYRAILYEIKNTVLRTCTDSLERQKSIIKK